MMSAPPASQTPDETPVKCGICGSSCLRLISQSPVLHALATSAISVLQDDRVLGSVSMERFSAVGHSQQSLPQNPPGIPATRIDSARDCFKMRRSNAVPHPAKVVYVECLRDFVPGIEIRPSVGVLTPLAIGTKLTVPVRVCLRSPQPARPQVRTVLRGWPALVDLAPETRGLRLSRTARAPALPGAVLTHIVRSLGHKRCLAVSTRTRQTRRLQTHRDDLQVSRGARQRGGANVAAAVPLVL